MIAGNKRVLVTGATGIIGQKLVVKLVNKGYWVAGLTTSKKGEALLIQLNAKPYVGDIYDEEFVNAMVSDFKPEIIIHQITDLKQMNGSANSSIRKIGTHNLTHAALNNNVKKIISQSIAWAYEAGVTLADENTPLDRHADEPRKTTIDGIVALETKIEEIPNHIILRYGVLYGKGTWYDNQGKIYQQFRSGDISISNGILSFIHIDDAINATIQSLHWPTGIYNIVDDDPVAGDEWSAFYRKKLNIATPITITEKKGWERGATNKKFKKAGGTLTYPSWRKGMGYLE